MKKKILIEDNIGCKNYDEAKKFIELCLTEISDKSSIAVILGAAKCVNSIGEKFAKENGLEIIRVFPDWKMLGRGALLKQNKEMINIADMVICLLDEESEDMLFTIEFAKKQNKILRIKNFLLLNS